MFFTTLLQTQFLPAFLPGVNQFVPDVVLLVVVCWALLLDWRLSLPLGFIAGLLLDLLSASIYPVGLNALLFTLIVMAIGFVGQESFQNGIVRSVPVALGAALGYRLARLLAEQLLGYNNVQAATIVQVILPVIIIDGALMLLVFGPVRLISRLRAPRE